MSVLRRLSHSNENHLANNLLDREDSSPLSPLWEAIEGDDVEEGDDEDEGDEAAALPDGGVLSEISLFTFFNRSSRLLLCCCTGTGRALFVELE